MQVIDISTSVWSPGVLCDADKQNLEKVMQYLMKNQFLGYLRTENADFCEILTDLAIYNHL